MKTKIFVILLSFTLFFTGCVNKSVGFDYPGQMQQTSYAQESSLGEKVLIGTALVGVAALVLTTAAVVILLLAPKELRQRP